MKYPSHFVSVIETENSGIEDTLMLPAADSVISRSKSRPPFSCISSFGCSPLFVNTAFTEFLSSKSSMKSVSPFAWRSVFVKHSCIATAMICFAGSDCGSSPLMKNFTPSSAAVFMISSYSSCALRSGSDLRKVTFLFKRSAMPA